MISSILKRAIGPSIGQNGHESESSNSVYTATKIEFVDLEKKDRDAGREVHPLRRGRYELLLTTSQPKTYRTVISKKEFDKFIHSARIQFDPVPPPAPPKVVDPSKIAKITARPIFDSSGWPAIEVELTMEDDARFCASAAVRYQREGQPKEENVEKLKSVRAMVERAIGHLNEKIGPSIVASSVLNSVTEQDKLDRHIAAGKRKPKNRGKGKRFAGYASMALSIAISKAGAAVKHIPLYEHIASLARDDEEGESRDECESRGVILPVPVFSMINVGRESAGGMNTASLPGYELLLIPSGARSFKQALEVGADVYHEVGRLIKSSGTGEEGGFSPNKLYSSDGLTFLLDEAIRRAGHGDGACSFVSSTSLSKKSFCAAASATDSPSSETKGFTSQQLKGVRKKLVKECRVAVMMLGEWDTRAYHHAAKYKYARNQRFTVQMLQTQSSVDDHLHHQNRGSRMRAKVSIVEQKEGIGGSDGTTDTPPNSVLLMPHPKGTISQLIKATKLCRELGWDVILGNRTGGGATEETFLADMTLGLGIRKIKTGAPAREKVHIYNRLLKIERELGERVLYAG